MNSADLNQLELRIMPDLLPEDLVPIQRELTPMGIFWDAENVAVKVCEMEIFAENIRSFFHKKNFHLKLFYVAGAPIYASAKDRLKRTFNADIEFELVPHGPDEADYQIINEIEEFYKKHGENSWIVLISTDANAFTDTVRERKNLVLVYDSKKKVTGRKMKEMLKHASFRCALEGFRP